ncbi:hypothetical protein RHS01_11336 [Rhizoctonia solani]|uniref:Uncharacterized protein n=1 Tax=Rhizoctonia solani TaxID=456999 RepID=A0A8H7LZ11_9AGAM|nr:hypothetical protein RHS01_11336 [Rhizoctonia solani]
MKWQPAPGAPLVPRPLSIKESWDPLFQQPPMSQQALNPRSMGKSPSAAQSPSSWDCKTKSSGSNKNLRNKKKPQRKPKTGWEQSIKPLLASRLGVEPTHTRRPEAPRNQGHARPLPKTNPLPAPSAPLIAWANPTKAPPAFAQPTPVRIPPQVHTPPTSAPIRLQSPKSLNR